MLTFALQAIGWALARTPEPVLRGLCRGLGAAMLCIPKRRHAVYSNLGRAFPERTQAWRTGVARESSRRLIETFLLSLASPFIPDERLRSMATLAPGALDALSRRGAEGRPMLLATLHLAHWEAQSWLGLLSPCPIGEVGTIYRPLNHAGADAFVKRTRERFGLRLLSRKTGLHQAGHLLKRGGAVGVLFDQNAGMQGSLTTLFGRVCSSSPLVGLLAERSGGVIRTFYPRRTGFWRIRLDSDPIPFDGTAEGATLALNRWLEDKLSGDDELCASWLWSHGRWRNQDRPDLRFRLEAKSNLLSREMAERGWTALPRRTRFVVRLPNWLGDVVMALPLLRALRRGRPDAELTLVGKAAFRALVEEAGVCDRFVALEGKSGFRQALALRHLHPDTWILLTHSPRGDAEARLSGARQRFGIVRPGHPRPLLTHAYRLPDDLDPAGVHQLAVWESFFRHFGLLEAPDLRPLRPAGGDPRGPVGLVCGSENAPLKRWPVASWRALIEALPDRRFVLLGTPRDAALTAQVAQGLPSPRVTDLAGRTPMDAYLKALAGCSLVVGNDTGGMHLANALGVPVIVLFGPTNPVRTGPVFDAPRHLLQPPGCPARGGASLNDLAPETVAASVRALLPSA